MTTDLSGPADTRSMRIVHTALRRDLCRAREVLSTAPYPHPVQRRALAAHLGWMMDFLHHHHKGEDTGLYPLVRDRAPAAAALLDAMDADHERIGPGMAAVRAAAAAYLDDPDARGDVLDALDELTAVLFPHLLREEQEMMPVVAGVLTQAEWMAWMQDLSAGKSMSALASEGLWILEAQPPSDVAVMVEVVPRLPRWIILNVLSRGYRKQAFRRWWAADHSRWKLPVSGTNTVRVAASPAQVWAVLADVTRIGEWSHECHAAHWLDGTTGGVGARFVGSNRAGRARWTRPCTITTYDEDRELVFETAGPLARDVSQWRFLLEPAGAGTRITQSFRILALPLWYDRLIWAVTPAHRDRVPALRADLERLGELARTAAPVNTA